MDTAIFNAAKNGHLETVQYLKEQGAKRSGFALNIAARHGHLEIVKYLTEQKEQTLNGLNIDLSAAAEGRHLDVIKYLITQGANNFYNALYDATQNGHLETVKFLMSQETLTGIQFTKDINSVLLFAARVFSEANPDRLSLFGTFGNSKIFTRKRSPYGYSIHK